VTIASVVPNATTRNRMRDVGRADADVCGSDPLVAISKPPRRPTPQDPK
jgi:hypothetical protein